MSSTTTTTVTQTRLEAAPPTSSGSVRAKLNFVVPPADGATPFHYVEEPPEGVPRDNFTVAEHEVLVSDVRGREADFDLDTNAFKVVKMPTTTTTTTSPAVDFADESSIKSTYYAEVEKLLLDNIPGSHKVVIFDHTVRKADPAAARAPVLRAHIDQTAKSAAWRVPLHVEDAEQAQALLQGRYRLVNVWRPINGAVESFPLAVADSASVPDSALVPIEHRYPNRTGETAGILFNESAKWYYLGDMRDDERLFLQCFDNVGGSRLPHTAFIHPNSTPASKPRESIEVRALVFG